MKQLDFTLSPFAPGPALAPFSITGTISREGTRLALSYRLAGPLQELQLPDPAPVPARRWLLWEATCLEFFLAPQTGPGYWEFNLSPAGHWNVFRLTGYRQGIEEEPALEALPFHVTRLPQLLTLSIAVDLAPLLSASTPVKAAVSAILQHHDDVLSFWALTHPSGQPDFHHPQGFCLKL